MSSASTQALYSPELLGLAVELAKFPYAPGAQFHGHARSRSCGSEVFVSFDLDASGRLRDPGLRVVACAVGQASSAIFADQASCKTAEELARALASLENWLGGDETRETLPRQNLLEPARSHPGRHEAILLPWRAALDALSTRPPSG